MSVRCKWLAWFLLVGSIASSAGAGIFPADAALAASKKLQGKFEQLDEPSTHTRGKVKMAEFADFYCPHCHMFEQTAIPMLEKEFGDRVEVTMVGFPVIRGMLPTAFEMYEQAKVMGKGREMKNVLFRTIHKDRTLFMDRTVRTILVKEIGLDPVTFEKGLASGKPARAFQKGKEWGIRIKVSSTPTVLLDGNIKVEGENLTPVNLTTVIRSILAADPKQ